MTFVCLWSPSWSESSLNRFAASALKIAPRISADFGKGLIWADGRSLDSRAICRDLITATEQYQVIKAQVATSIIPVAAELAARFVGPDSSTSATTIVPVGGERDFIGHFPISVLAPSKALDSMFEATGIEKCGDLARLEQEAVEVRFGAEGVELWRLARADDRRPIFGSSQRALPESSMDWVDYSLTDPERLVFVINALVDNVCGSLASQGQCAREMTLSFSLANRTTYDHPVCPARSTSSRRAWMRLIRTHLDIIRLPDAVTGLALRVESVTGEVERQGDIFDRGFATARATEEAVAQLLDDQGAVIVVPQNTRHPLLERRTEWVAQAPEHAARTAVSRDSGIEPRLTLQLLSSPRPISVKTAKRRDHHLPLKYRDTDGWTLIESAAGPDRVSGGKWESEGTYSREYFRCVTEEGAMVWIFMENNEWYLQGWWD
jgi:hypothetical protein